MKITLSALKTVQARHPEVDSCVFLFVITRTSPSQVQLADLNLSCRDFEMLRDEVEAECEKAYKHRQIGWKIVHVDEGFTLARFLTDDNLNYHDVVFLCTVRNLMNSRDTVEPLSCEDIAYCMEFTDWYCSNNSGDEDIEPLFADDIEDCMGHTYDKQSPGYAELMANKRDLYGPTCIGTIIFDKSRNIPIVAIEGNYLLSIEDAVNIAATECNVTQSDDTDYFVFPGSGYIDGDDIEVSPWYKGEDYKVPVVRRDDPNYVRYMFLSQ